MIERGDVVVALRRIGFGPHGEGERFVVVQDEGLSTALASMVVVPLETWAAGDAGDPLSVRVSKREAGTKTDVAARVPLLGARPSERFAAHPVGRLAPATLAVLELRIRLLLGLS